MPRGLQRRLARLLYPHGSVRTVLRGPHAGMKYLVGPGMGFRYCLAPEVMNFRFLQSVVRPGMTVYDVGANKGQMTLFFAACVGPAGRVHSFEPAAEEFESLERNVRLNALSNVRVWPVALAERDGEAAFRYSPHKPTGGRLQRSLHGYTNLDMGQERRVRTRTLDSLAAEGVPPPDFVKVDVEGAGDAVLRGGRNLLEECSPSIYFELHGGAEKSAVRDELQSRGYRIETLDGNVVRDLAGGWYNPLWCRRGTPRLSGS